MLANRFRGGARSTKSSKKGSSSSSQSSGPGSLASARSRQNFPDPFAPAPVPVLPTQSSVDEIDAFTDNTIRVPGPAASHDTPAVGRSALAPSPSSNLPPASERVFSRPSGPFPVIVGATEDVPTAVPSRAPSRAASVASAASAASTGDAGIADLLQVDHFPTPSDPPPLADVIGRIHRQFPLASLKVDDDDPRHFLARDNTRADGIANDIDHLLSSNTTWASLFFFIRDALKFEAIKGPVSDFHAFLNGLADIWSDPADFDLRQTVKALIEAERYFPKAEKEIDRLEQVAARYRGERKSAREQLKTTEAELSRLRQAANDTLDSNARLLTEIDQLCATDAVAAIRDRDDARDALNNIAAHAKTAMAKQVSRYQHLSNIADERGKHIQELELEARDKDAYVVKTEQEHAVIYREREASERQVASLKKQLEETTTLFETAREARRLDGIDFNERVISFKQHIADLNARLNLLPAGEAELRSLVTDANERAGIAEEEYRKKSAELKAALKEIDSLKAKSKLSTNAPTVAPSSSKNAAKEKSDKTKEQAQLQSSKKVRWSFEPENPSSQPFWDHSNEYSRYIADMVAATVSALPNIPMQTAISTAIDMVRAAGPAILSQLASKPNTDSKRTPTGRSSPSPGPNPNPGNPQNSLSSATAPRRSQAPSPSTAKPASTTPDAKPIGSMTFAQMAVTVLDPPAATSMHPAKAKPTWRAIETNKSLVLRPGTKGTRVSELHIRVPKVPATTHLFSLSGTFFFFFFKLKDLY